jgi:hypothetical protein
MVDYKLKNGNILKDGHTMFLQDAVSDLRRKAYLEDAREIQAKIIENQDQVIIDLKELLAEIQSRPKH